MTTMNLNHEFLSYCTIQNTNIIRLRIICPNIKTPHDDLGPLFGSVAFHYLPFHLGAGRALVGLSRWRAACGGPVKRCTIKVSICLLSSLKIFHCHKVSMELNSVDQLRWAHHLMCVGTNANAINTITITNEAMDHRKVRLSFTTFLFYKLGYPR